MPLLMHCSQPCKICNSSPAGHRSLPECFQLFDMIHKVVTSHDIVTQITEEVIEDFANENVVYLELRTTPKVILLLFSDHFCLPLNSVCTGTGHNADTRSQGFCPPLIFTLRPIMATQQPVLVELASKRLRLCNHLHNHL